jgi:hypothetical protein
MKLITWNKIVPALGISSLTLTLALASGCVVRPDGRVEAGVEVTAPTPEVTVETAVPDDYVWDGYEYVGLVGDQYYYLGSGNVWIIADPFRLNRFHGWERGHPDWRTHAIRNERFRRDTHGHEQPRHDVPAHRNDRDHDHDHDQ